MASFSFSVGTGTLSIKYDLTYPLCLTISKVGCVTAIFRVWDSGSIYEYKSVLSVGILLGSFAVALPVSTSNSASMGMDRKRIRLAMAGN